MLFQNIVNAVGAILDPSNAAFWASMHNRSSGAMELIVVLEAYTVALARNAPQLFTQPFDAVHPNLSELLVWRMMLSGGGAGTRVCVYQLVVCFSNVNDRRVHTQVLH